MKKSLSILLTLIFTFSCFSVLGTSVALAEETVQTQNWLVLQSDFNDADGTNWRGTKSNVQFLDENNNGTNDYARVNSSSSESGVGLVSETFELINGNEYELTFKLRIPSDSASYLVGSKTFYAPNFFIYEPNNTTSGTTANLTPKKSETSSENNLYAYTSTDSWARRSDFEVEWEIGDIGTISKSGNSHLSYEDQKDLLGSTTNAKTTYSEWTTITARFTAVADEEDEVSQIVALGFTFYYLKSSGFIFDIKNVKLINKSVPAPETQKTILTSDFDISDGTKWAQTITSVDPVQFMVDEKDGANFVRISSLNQKSTGIKSTPFNLIPGKDYELSFYIRVPENTKSYIISSSSGDVFYAPSILFYEAQANSDGTTSNNPVQSSKAEQNNYYAYSNMRRHAFTSNWTIGDYGTYKREHYSSFAYSNQAAVLKEQFTDINAAYKNWTKITARFTALADEESETEQLTALAFYFSDKVADLQFDIKDVKLIENPDALPEDTEDDGGIETPEEIIPELPYLSIVDAKGNQLKSGADIGAKVDVKANEDGSNTFTLTYDDMDSVNLFKGWYDGDTFLSADTTFTASADVNKDNVKAKILCRSVISGGLGFENYTEKTSLRVSPEDSNQNLHNIAPFDDKWGQMYKSYQQANEWCMTIQSVNGTQTVKYTTDYVDGAYTTDYVNVAPYSGNSMFNFAARGRAVVRKLDNLRPNTYYELSFYVYNTSNWDFLNKAIITDSYELSTGNLYPSTAKVYSAYVADTELDDKNGKATLKDKNLIHNWSKVTISFKTDSNDTFVYLQLSQANGKDDGSTSNIFLDNLTCTETVLGYTGNAIRANSDTTPQALRYKFAMDNDMLAGFAGMTTKKVGVLAVKSDVCGDDTLEIGKTYTKDGKVTAVKDVEVTENNFVTDSEDSSNKYFTVALYNIGKKGNNVDYSAYGNDYAVRPYVIYTDANGVESVVYGTTVNANVFNVMLAIFSENKSESDIEIAKGLLEKEEISKEYYKWQPTDNWYLGESKATDYAYSFAVIGDIQKTTRKFPDKLHYIYDWILANKDSKNIQYAMSMGDLTDANTDVEWDRATEQHDRLQNVGLNQSIVRGNHDQVKGFDANITAEKYGDGLYSTFNGMRNTCRRVTISGVKYMVITLDLYPSDEEVAWAEDLIVNNPDYNVVLTTHAYFKNVSGKGKIELETSIRSDFVSNKLAEGQVAADLNSGQEIFDKLVNKYSNIVLVLCGHNDPYDDGPNHRITTREDGSQVVEMMTNFQDMEDRINRSYGMLAMLYIKADGTVQLEFFSTINGMFYKDDFQFEFKLDLVD